jgi:hypothetical protein
VKGIQVFFLNKGPGPLQRVDNHKNVKVGWGLLKNHWANFNQTWHKSSGEGLKFVQMKGIASLKGEVIAKE